jgi:hypothetical protein
LLIVVICIFVLLLRHAAVPVHMLTYKATIIVRSVEVFQRLLAYTAVAMRHGDTVRHFQIQMRISMAKYNH